MNITREQYEANTRADIIIESHQGGLFDRVQESPGATRALKRVLAGTRPPL